MIRFFRKVADGGDHGAGRGRGKEVCGAVER